MSVVGQDFTGRGSTGFDDWHKAALGVVDQLRSDAAVRDSEAADPVREVELLRQSGLLGIYLPQTVGGGGASFAELQQIIRLLATADTSIAQISVFHYLLSRAVVGEGTTDLGRRHAAGVVEKGWFTAPIAQAAYEPLISATPDGDGFRLNGSKPFTTGAAVADALVVWTRFADGSRIRGEDVSGLVGLAVVASPGEGIVFGNDWDGIGQRLTVSGTTTLTDVPLAPDSVLTWFDPAQPLPPAHTLDVPQSHLAFGNLYLGTAIGAFNDAVEYTRSTSRPWHTSGVTRAADDPLVTERYGRLWIAIESAIALADRAAEIIDAAAARGADLTEDERGRAAVAAYSSKVHSAEVALEVTSRIFELTGARSATRKLALDRYWRNVRTHTLHDPLHYKVLEVGDYALNGRSPKPTYYS